MGAVLEEIRSGRFAEEWSRARDGFPELRERIRSAREGLPLAAWERKARAALGTAKSE
jgi:ketol-acid reductoisomerase